MGEICMYLIEHYTILSKDKRSLILKPINMVDTFNE